MDSSSAYSGSGMQGRPLGSSSQLSHELPKAVKLPAFQEFVLSPSPSVFVPNMRLSLRVDHNLDFNVSLVPFDLYAATGERCNDRERSPLIKDVETHHQHCPN